jgi:Zn-finger nucleic acid-binding protein
MEDITLDLTDMMSDQCEKSGGVWADASELGRLNPSEYNNLTAFYSDVFNNNQTYVSDSASWGRCVETTTRAVCNAYNIDSDSTTPVATYDAASDTCSFTNEWYKKKCTEELGGTWEDTICYVK